MVLRDFLEKGTLFFSQIYTLSEFCSILGLPIVELHRITKWGVVGFVAQNEAFSKKVCFSQLAKYCSWQSKKPASYCMVTNLLEFLFVSIFLVSETTCASCLETINLYIAFRKLQYVHPVQPVHCFQKHPTCTSRLETSNIYIAFGNFQPHHVQKHHTCTYGYIIQNNRCGMKTATK